MATGFSYISSRDDSQKKAEKLKKTIKKIMAKHGMDDPEWIRAISGQFFLLSLGRELNWHRRNDYEKLMNSCLSSFRVTYQGDFVLDEKSLQVTPEETKHIMELMEEEDRQDSYFTRFPKTSAKNINSQRMYLNFHYALLLSIVSEEDSDLFKILKNSCMEYLFSEKALDDSDGWYPYRVPWITARVLINLKSIDYSDFANTHNIDGVINDALESLFQRINEIKPIWRSGFGTWVTNWESTGLCLEALHNWNVISQRTAEIRKIIFYVLSSEVCEEWLDTSRKFDGEESSNAILGSVVLASSVYRIIRDEPSFADLYEEHQEKLFNYFIFIVDMIHKGNVEQVGQFTTVPQILFYIMLAIA